MNSFDSFSKSIKKRKILSKYGLTSIGVFGSFARGEEAHDIDVYLDDTLFDMKKILQLRDDLEKISNMEVDIVLKQFANPIILHRAQKDMRFVTE
jgi:uncharacterized protein